MLCEDLDEWDGKGQWGSPRERGYVRIAESLHCTAETNTNIVKQLYSNFFKK